MSLCVFLNLRTYVSLKWDTSWRQRSSYWLSGRGANQRCRRACRHHPRLGIVVNLRKVIESTDADEVQELLTSNDHRESQIDDDDLLDIEWIHDDVEITVTP